MTKNSKPRILFVDDEPNVLEGLRNMLRRMRNDWDVEFAESGRKALESMRHTPADIVVSDMRMPEMDGVQLLNMIKSLYPGTVRFILSGHSDRESVLRSVGPTHQFLSKPCNADELRNAVCRGFSLRELLGKENLMSLVLDVKAIPTVPELYASVCAALNSPNCSPNQIGAIISKDIAISAKVLQLVNSAFFGLRRRVGDVEQAVALLGIDTIKALVLTAGVFQEFTKSEMSEFAVHELYAHSLHVGNASLRVAKRILPDQKMIDEAMMAGVMHDLGKIILIRNHADAYREIRRQSEVEGRRLCAVEQEFLGVTHAEIGAYVLGLWGLSDSIVEAAAFHHNPTACVQQSLSVLSTVYLTNALSLQSDARKTGVPWEEAFSDLDVAYIRGLGIEKMLWELADMARPSRDVKEVLP
jgi:HD-like signal output (HDOD) protein/ActR/RegA family two-component response regulator